MLSKISFNKNKRSFLEISKSRIFFGLFLGIFYAVIFYAFLQLFRKSIIVFDAMLNDYELFLVTEKANQFYNFLFAFIAVFFSFTLVFIHFFDTPKKFLSKYNYKRKSIINQQRLMNWFFLSWFSRIAYFIGLLALSYEGVNLYSENKHILILFIIVFFGQIWISIRWFFKKNKLKWFCITFFSCLLFSFGLSKIDLLKAATIDKVILQKNLFYKHKVHVVTSDVATKRKYKYLCIDIVIPNEINKQTIIFEGEEINEKELEDRIIKHWYQFSEAEIPFINHTLFIDKNVKMKVVYDLKKRMNKINVERVSYSTKKHGTKKPFYYKSENALSFYLPNNFIDIEKDISKEVSIKIAKNGLYILNDKSISKDKLTKSIKEYFELNGTKSIRVYINENTLFHEYFKVLESSKKAVDELRNEYSQKGYALDFSLLNREQRSFIRKKIRWHIIDEIK
jgi:biopolymer transport protein ExbD